MDDLSTKLLTQSILEQIPSLQGQALDFLEGYCRQGRVRSFLEIGTGNGKTSLALAKAFPELQVTTIEKDEKTARLARENIEQSGLKERVHLIVADAMDVEFEKESFDLIFLDGPKGQYIRHFLHFAPALKEQGVIISDNLNFHGLVDHPERTKNRHTKGLLRHIREYRKFLQENTQFSTEFLEIGDGLALSKRRPTC